MVTAAAVDPHETATVRHVDSVFAQVPAFPGGVRLSSAPDPQLEDPPGLTRPPTMVQRTGWWVSPTAPEQFRAWLLAHVPSDWSRPGGDPDSPGQWGTTGFLEQFTAGPRSDAVWTYSAVNVFWVPAGDGTAIRVTAQADWVATRSTDEFISDAANTVDVRVFVPDVAFATTARLPPTVHRSLTGSAAATLRNLVNSLNPWTDTGVHGCLANFGMTDVLVFSGGGVTTTLTVHSDGCTGTGFVSAGRVFPALEDDVLHAELVKLLRLPAPYTDYW